MPPFRSEAVEQDEVKGDEKDDASDGGTVQPSFHRHHSLTCLNSPCKVRRSVGEVEGDDGLKCQAEVTPNQCCSVRVDSDERALTPVEDT